MIFSIKDDTSSNFQFNQYISKTPWIQDYPEKTQNILENKKITVIDWNEDVLETVISNQP